MADEKWIITYEEINYKNKKIFLFVNHKVATLCWAQIKKEFGLCDVITFDSHVDYSGGFITKRNLPKLHSHEQLFFGSKFLKQRPHFSKFNDFVQWNPLDETQNKSLIQKENKFFAQNNDDFIDVAFMKNLIGDCYAYYLFKGEISLPNCLQCDDLTGNLHKFKSENIQNFIFPNNNFIFDLDLDFFTYEDESKFELCDKGELESAFTPTNSEEITKHLTTIKKILDSDNCIGVTIALEPIFCGGKNDCINLVKELSKSLKKDFKTPAEKLLNEFYAIAKHY